MPSLNQMTAIGNLGHDPSMRYLDDGTPVVNFNIAVSNPFRKDDPPLWLKVTTWRKTAEACAQYLAKGDPVLVQGRVSLDEWTGRDGEHRAQIALDARDVTFLSGGERNGDGGSRSRRNGDGAWDPNEPPPPDDDDRMPFD